jgi:hypothetical protein
MIKNVTVYNISLFVLVLGIVCRFYHQFIMWSFNGDEINLGLNILNKSFEELVHPLENGQSAPPLFLWLEKILSPISKPYLSLKIITFISSSVSLLLFNRIIKTTYEGFLYILLLTIFTFNPFIFYNSLTLKQYSFDLLMGLLAVNFFIDSKKILKSYFFFAIWCFLSNTGLLFSAGFIIYHSLKLTKIRSLKIDFKTLKIYLGQILPYLLAPWLYLIYFYWYMNQSGASEMKSYMVHYWQDSFLPLNEDVFKWIAFQLKGIYFFFFSSYTFLGLTMLAIFLIGLHKVIFLNKKDNSLRIQKIIIVYLGTITIHLLLSAIKMYPFSDRLYLYIAPIVIIILGEGIQYGLVVLKKRYDLNSYSRYLYLIPVYIGSTYFTYFPFRENDVLSLIQYYNLNNLEKIFVTEKSKATILDWIEFTEYTPTTKLKNNLCILTVDKFNTLQYKDIIISRQHHKFGHLNKTSGPEDILQNLIEKDLLKVKLTLDGYTLYEVK